MERGRLMGSRECSDVRLLRLRPPGMFSNVNEVVEQARLAEDGGYRFAIDWSRSCYAEPGRAGDPWSYYFEPCWPDLPLEAVLGADLPVLPGGKDVACTRANIITPRREDGNCTPLLIPRDRSGAGALIARYVRINAMVTAEIARAGAALVQPGTVGLHIRGPGRTHGGTLGLRRRHAAEGGVPLDLYFGHADAALAERPGARIFACSDSARVIAAVRDRYGKRAVFYDASRSAFGEMHDAAHPANAGLDFSPYKLGLDVLVEAHLLAETDVFVHGNSNVANFVLCKNPKLRHVYVYA